MKKRIAMILIALIVCAASMPVNAVNEYDAFLLSLGVPASVIEEMSEGQKEMICGSIDSDAAFVSFDSDEYVVNEDDGTIQPRYDYTIPSSDLTLSVTCFETTEISQEGNPVYAIYPSFVWHTQLEISGDLFGFALYPGWEVIPQRENIRVYLGNYEGHRVQYADYDPTAAAYSGYAYTMSTFAFTPHWYEGHAYVYAQDKAGNSTRAIAINYSHDESGKLTTSLSASIGPASVSVDTNGVDCSHMAGTFYLYN